MYENVVSTVKLDYRWWIVLVRQLYAGSSTLLVTGLSEILYIYIVIFISPVTNIGAKLHLLLRNIGPKLRPYILKKFKFGKTKRKTINKTI